MGLGGDFPDPGALIRRHTGAIEALGDELAGTGKPLVSTSGTLVLRAGEVATERDAPDPESLGAFRVPGEQTCLGYADRDARASVVRLAPTVHGPGDYGFIPVLIAAARRNGVSAYAGDGASRWPAVHRLDAARLFRLALEGAPAGSVLHGVTEALGEKGETAHGPRFRAVCERLGIDGAAAGLPRPKPDETHARIAERIARILDIPTASLTPEEFGRHLDNPFLARAFATDAPVSSDHTQELLGWAPSHATLLEDLEISDYFTPEATTRTEAHWSR